MLHSLTFGYIVIAVSYLLWQHSNIAARLKKKDDEITLLKASISAYLNNASGMRIENVKGGIRDDKDRFYDGLKAKTHQLWANEKLTPEIDGKLTEFLNEIAV